MFANIDDKLIFLRGKDINDAILQETRGSERTVFYHFYASLYINLKGNLISSKRLSGQDNNKWEYQ